jgi:hypothetical protein
MRSITSPASTTGLGAGERVGGLGSRLSFDKGQALGADAETLKVGAGNVQIDFVTFRGDAADFVDHFGACMFDLISDLGH